MNPNRLIGDVKLDEGLRLGPDYRPPELKTHFAYPDDGGSFATAIERCFGMAKCRNLGSLTMCPSFHATREERHSTRGRSRLLFEMLKGDPVTDGLARRRGQGVARPVPVVQGMHRRLPGPGRHPDLQGRVPRPLLRKAPAAAAPLRARPAALVGAGRRRARPGSSTALSHSPPVARPDQAAARDRRGARDPEVRPPDVPQLVRGQERPTATTPPPRTADGAARRAVARHVHRPVRARRRQGRGRRARGRRVRGRDPAEARVLRAAAVRLRDARPRQAHPPEHARRRCPSRSSRACRCSCSSRAAPRCSATSCAS